MATLLAKWIKQNGIGLSCPYSHKNVGGVGKVEWGRSRLPFSAIGNRPRSKVNI